MLTTIPQSIFVRMFKKQTKPTDNGFEQLVPFGVVVTQPVPHPLPTGRIGGPGHHDASLARHLQQGTRAQEDEEEEETEEEFWVTSYISLDFRTPPRDKKNTVKSCKRMDWWIEDEIFFN